MRFFPGAGLAGLTLPLLLGACTGGESLPDDPRPASSAASLVPPAAISAVLAPTLPTPVGAGTPLPLLGALSAPTASIHDDAPVLSKPGLPPEVVRRITRQNFGRFRLCYQRAAALDPTLRGTLTVRYVIDPDGAVSIVGMASTTFTDSTLNECLLAVYRGLSFPMTSGGAVTVTHTIHLAPGSP